MQKSTLTEDLLFILTGLAILLVCLWDGIGITFDSYLYLLGSTYLQQHGLTDIFIVPAFRAKPPVLAILYALLQNNLWLIKLATLAFLAGTLWVNFRLATILISDTFFRRFAKALLATATPFMLVHSFLWSEPFFIFIFSLYGLCSYRALQKQVKTSQLYLLPLLGLLLIGLRHIGVVFVLGYSLYLLLHYRKFAVSARVPLMLNVLLPVLGLFAWHSSVLAHSSNAGGYDLLQGLDVWRNFMVYADVLKVWLLPPGLPFAGLLNIVVVIVYLAAAVLAIKQSYTSEKRHLVLLFILGAAAYGGLMLFKGDLLVSDNERYLAVIYAPLTLLLFYVISNLASHTTINRKLIYLAFILWFCYPLMRTLYNTSRWAQNGINYYNPETAPEEIKLHYRNPK
ncbi:hypothetical protein WG947_12565 [Pontibacter sp. H259]|uniref:hypothetical protein n=1 Tax=Pontibacter sp. H259 TaxID=3133421 RepID=UPI0030BA3DF0